MYFFWKKLCSFIDFIYLCSRNACPCEGGYVKLTSMERDLRPLVRPVSKGRFLNVTVCKIKLRNFESKYGGDATRDVYVGWFYISPTAIIPFIYIIRCTPQLRCTLFAYIFQGWIPWICISWNCYGRGVYILSLAWAGFTLLILFLGGNAKAWKSRDRRGWIHTPTSFLFP